MDITFGSSGKRSVSFSQPVAPDHQKVIAGYGEKILQCFSISNGINNDFGLARYNQDGSLDPGFGSGGLIQTDFGGNETATSMMVASGGKIIVGGFSVSTSTGIGVFAMARYLPGGALDPGFGTGGKVVTSIGSDAFAYSLNIQRDGKIILAGFCNTGSGYVFALVRYSANGALDGTFGTGGRVTTSFAGVADAAYGTLIQNDDKIVVVGGSSDGNTSAFAVARYLPLNGALDPGFDGDGKATVVIGAAASNWDVAHSVIIDTSGSLVLAGSTLNGSNSDFALARFTKTGVLDLSFKGNGKVVTDFGGGLDNSYAIAIQSDGKYLVSGEASNGTDQDFIVARYNHTGDLDEQFGVGNLGYTLIDFGGEDYGYSMSSQGTNLLIGGTAGTGLGLARLVNSSVVLPLSFSSFIATKGTEKVLLNWQTSQENNTGYFEVQRSSDGVHFVAIGSVRVKDLSENSGNYSFTDLDPSNVNFYRIKMINTGSASVFSRTVLIRFDVKVQGLHLFPNPVKDHLNIQLTAPAGKQRIVLMDVNGRILVQKELVSTGTLISTSLDMSSLQKGIYFLRANEELVKVVKD